MVFLDALAENGIIEPVSKFDKFKNFSLFPTERKIWIYCNTVPHLKPNIKIEVCRTNYFLNRPEPRSTYRLGIVLWGHPKQGSLPVCDWCSQFNWYNDYQFSERHGGHKGRAKTVFLKEFAKKEGQ